MNKRLCPLDSPIRRQTSALRRYHFYDYFDRNPALETMSMYNLLAVRYRSFEDTPQSILLLHMLYDVLVDRSQPRGAFLQWFDGFTADYRREVAVNRFLMALSLWRIFLVLSRRMTVPLGTPRVLDSMGGRTDYRAVALELFASLDRHPLITNK